MTRRGNTTSVGMRNRVRYRFDALLSRGTWAALVFLGAITLALIIFSAAVLALADVTLAGSDGTSFLEDLWQSLLRAIDPGTMASDVGWGRRLLALLITLLGILVAGTLIGLIASGVEQRVDEMQRGRSQVVESDHVLILGASARLPVIVNQLTLAGRTRRDNAIVVLADRDPREMNDETRALVRDTRQSRLVFRRGDPGKRADLVIAAVDAARFVIILASDDAENDAGVVKAVLAVGAELGGFDRTPIVAELSDVATAAALAEACGGEVHPMVPFQAVSRVAAFMLAAPGLGRVVEELLDFRGSDIYVRRFADLEGRSFRELVTRFSKARPIGRIDPDGLVELNPPPETTLAAGDRLVIIADDGTQPLAVSPFSTRHDPVALAARPRGKVPQREDLLIVGWNSLGRQLVGQLAQTLAPGSSARVIYDARLFQPDELDIPDAEGLAVTTTPIRTDSWQPTRLDELAGITSVVFLGYRRGVGPDAADSRTLLNLMLLKRKVERAGSAGPRIVAELLNPDNVDLALTTGADDFVVSDAMASRLLAQLAQMPERRPVFLALFSSDGPSVHLAEAQDLGVTAEVAWHEVVEAVYEAGLLAIGWRRSSERGSQVELNPDAADRVLLQDGDQIVVIG